MAEQEALRFLSGIASSSAHSLLARNSANDIGVAPSDEIGGEWEEKDTHGALLVIFISCGCLVSIAALVSISAAMHWKGILSGEVVKTHPAWRQVVLTLIGGSPLVVMLLLGEMQQNVLIAMLAMHWGCMLLLPIAYYVVRSHEDPASRPAMLAYYSQLLVEQRADCGYKLLRGLIIGIPLFIIPICSYFCMRCETFDWALCVRSFEKPLGAYGLKAYSMNFKLLIGLYFTFVNPVFEEFFWRLFLHRELTILELGADVDVVTPDESAQLVVGETPKASPWSDLVRWRHMTLYSEACRWLVCALYASYHVWPISVIFGRLWWLYAVGGFCGLAALGRALLLLRETPQFGVPAAVVAHICIDAAFAVICFVKF